MPSVVGANHARRRSKETSMAYGRRTSVVFVLVHFRLSNFGTALENFRWTRWFYCVFTGRFDCHFSNAFCQKRNRRSTDVVATIAQECSRHLECRVSNDSGSPSRTCRSWILRDVKNARNTSFSNGRVAAFGNVGSRAVRSLGHDATQTPNH